MAAETKAEPDIVRVGDKDYDLSKEKKWVQEYVAELREAAENAQGELFEENTLIDQREAIAGLWEMVAERRMRDTLVEARTLDGVEAGGRAYQVARLIRAATQVGIRMQQL